MTMIMRGKASNQKEDYYKIINKNKFKNYRLID